MKVLSITECSPLEHSAILSTFIKLPFVIKIFVLSIFEWPFYTGFTVQSSYINEWCTLFHLKPTPISSKNVVPSLRTYATKYFPY